MVRYCCEMYIKFRFVIFIFLLLPVLILSSNVRKRRRPGLEKQNQEDSKETYPDQVALATNYHHQNYPANEQFAENTDSDNVHHHIQQQSDEKNTNDGQHSKFFEENLANTKTAQEYVEKAIQLHGNHGNSNPAVNIIPKSHPNLKINIIPRSSSPKYEVYEGEESQTETPIQYFDKDTVTRSSYDLFDFNDNDYIKQQQQQQHRQNSGYSTVRYEPMNYEQNKYNRLQEPNRHEDHIQASPSEMPKEEILKHIEDSVMKYMKTLEAEGKIPPPQEPKIYYQIQHQISPEQENHQYNGIKHKGVMSLSENRPRFPHPTPTTALKILLNDEDVYQSASPTPNIVENMQDNVEFVYKVKTRSPIPKYKSLPPPQQQQQQRNPSNVDHSSAFKHLQGIDLSHFIPDERPTKAKLYFNTETYRDINSLPYKPEKIHHRQENKEREQHQRRPPTFTSSHQESNSDQYVPITEHQSSNQNVDGGYPVMNPYRYILHKEAIPKYEPDNGLSAQPSNWQPYHPNKDNIQIDSYNPKFNNNPEGFGYQHNFKPPQGSARVPKRGKRGQNYSKKHGRNFAPNKDPEANVALRPPSKNNKQS